MSTVLNQRVYFSFREDGAAVVSLRLAPFSLLDTDRACQSNLAVLSRLSEPIRARPRAEVLSSGGSPPFWPVFGGERIPVAVPICTHAAGSSRGISRGPPTLAALYLHYFGLLSKRFSPVSRVIVTCFPGDSRPFFLSVAGGRASDGHRRYPDGIPTGPRLQSGHRSVRESGSTQSGHAHAVGFPQ